MTALLTDNLPLLVGAPNGIKKLRELILDLAVRGKLVPQDPNDEPASELLKRIAEEKARFVAEGTIRKQKPLADISEVEQFFELPSGWEWIRLGTIQTFTNGYAFKSHDFQETGVGVIRIGDVKREGFISTNGMVRFPKEKLSEIDSRYFVEPGDLVISMTGDVKLAFNRSDERFLLNQRVGKISIHQASEKYICLLLTTQAQEKIEQASGSVISNVSTEEINNSVISLPPLAEQHRIVAKVDELMALCDRLEAQQADAESAHAQLVQALLDSLTQASHATDFAANWQRLAKHFHTLLTTESSIDTLKQSVLQLAVMGKLVPQDSNDEPASDLLKRITEEKTRLAAAGKIKKPKALAEVAEEEKLFELANSWQWCRLGQLIEFVNGFAFSSQDFGSEGVGIVKIGDIKNNQLTPDSMSRVKKAVVNQLDPRFQVEPGDLLIAMSGATTGKLGFNTTSEIFYLNQRVGKIIPIITSARFIFFDLTIKIVENLHKSFGSAIPNLSTEQVNEILVALPPLAEQHRIVAKVDVLMALCDQLKTRLTQARQLNEQLASTLVEQSVA